MHRLLALVFAILVLPVPSLSAQDTWRDPHPGVRWFHRQTSNQNAHVLVVDLCHAGVSVRTTASSERGRTPSSFASLTGATAVVNGDFFRSGYSVDGLAAHDGVVWPGHADHGYVSPIAFGAGRAGIVNHEVVAGPEPWMREIVSGHPTILRGGGVFESTDPLCTARHPRTAAGLSADQATLYMAVIDGRASRRIGMTCAEVATLLRDLGASDVVNLDGGGSSAMWLAGHGVVTNPSDGSQRTVGNHLAIYARGSGAAAHCARPWAASFAAQSFPFARELFEIPAGSEVAGSIELRNEGTETWTPGATFLGTTEPRDGPSPLVAGDWVSDHRAATVAEPTAPGAVGRFAFSVRAPDAPGEYAQFFNLVQEGVSWFASPPDDQLQVRVTSVAVPCGDVGDAWECRESGRARCVEGSLRSEACATGCIEGECAVDVDGDGHAAGADCDDMDPEVYPGAVDVCGDGVDSDCDGSEGCGSGGDAGAGADGGAADGGGGGGGGDGGDGGSAGGMLEGGCSAGGRGGSGIWLGFLLMLFWRRGGWSRVGDAR